MDHIKGFRQEYVKLAIEFSKLVIKLWFNWFMVYVKQIGNPTKDIGYQSGS